MTIDERELRSRLEETAAQAEAPRFTADDLAARVRRIRRRRRSRALIGAGVLVPAVVAAIAIPLLGGGSGEPAGISSPEVVPPGPSYTVTVNGQSSVVPAIGPGGPTEYYVTPNEKLTITVNVTAPARPLTTALWLGITDGVLAPRLDGPADMNPILATSTHAPLRPGRHRFVLHWSVPAQFGPGASRQLAVEYLLSGPEPGAGAERILAQFVAPPGPAFSAAAVGRLRAAVLQEADGCNDPRPAWIMAVRTTLGRATAEMGGGPVPDNASQVVYLLVMKGDFTGAHATMPPCAGAAAGRYLYTVVDAATLGRMSEWLTNRPPAVRLQALGPTRNLT